MVELPTFDIWFNIVVANAMAAGEEMFEDVVSISNPPLHLAIRYRSMYAFENHLRVASEKSHLSTFDSRVIATFEQECRSHSNDRNPFMASLEYVGWIEEILELDYGRFQTIVLLCNWVVANYEGSSAIVKCDEYGFTMINFEHLVPLFAQSFAFPMHVEQIFFVDGGRVSQNWNVVLRKEPEGARSKFIKKTNPKLALFDLGNNFNHPGLKVTTNPIDDVVPMLPNVEMLIGDLITPTQVMVEKMAIPSKDDENDGDNSQDMASSEFEGESSFSLRTSIYIKVNDST
jgi:hypothetical protein